MAQSRSTVTHEAADARFCQPFKIHLPRQLMTASEGPVDSLPIIMEANEIQRAEADMILLLGDVVIQQGKRTIHANAITYFPESQHADARGQVVLYTVAGDELRAESLNVQLETRRVVADTISIRIADTRSPPRDQPIPLTGDRGNGSTEKTVNQRARVMGDRLEMQGRDKMVLTNASMTTCPEGNQDVVFQASKLELDHATGIGTASGMRVQLKGIPVFYFPRLSFPINEARKTGFLSPSIGHEGSSGVVFEWPFYLNLAPAMDATVTPRFLSQRGGQVWGEFRYLGRQSSGMVQTEYLPSDNQSGGRDRYALNFDHSQAFGEHWQWGIDLQDVSDLEYIRDFSSDLDTRASSLITRRSRLEGYGHWLDFHIQLRAQESVNRRIYTSQTPYRTLPEVGLRLRPRRFGIFQGGGAVRWTRFDHQDDRLVRGVRTLIRPYLSIPLQRPYGSLEPRVSLQSVHYRLDNAPDHSLAESIPIFSLDGKLVFERLFDRGGKTYYQTLEPRLYYLNIPERSAQSTFPDFDTQEIQPRRYDHFFREGRFLGGDRVGDTEHVAVGLTSRVMDQDTGIQRLKLNLGQIFYLKDRHIRLNASEGPMTGRRSDVMANMTAMFHQHWSVDGFALWGMESGHLDRYWLSVDYRPGWRRKATLAFSEGDESRKLMQLELSVPWGPRWQMDLNTAYSVEENEFRFSTIGMSHHGCCWAMRLEYRHFPDEGGGHRDQVRMTLQLDGLGKMRSPLGSGV